MNLDIENVKSRGPSNAIPHQLILWKAIFHTLLLLCFLAEAIAEGSSQAPLVSYVFDDDAKQLVVASCFEGVGSMVVFDMIANL